MVDHSPVLSVGGYPLSKALLTDLTKLRPPFDDQQAASDYFGKKLEGNWELHSISPSSNSGYDGALFSTIIEGKKHYFIYHQGTNDSKDVPSFLRLANGKPPQQLEEARAFHRSVKAMLALTHPDEQVPVIQVGYSLGGAIAILASEGGQPVIAFDPPGTKQALAAMGRNTDEIGQHVLEVLSPHENFANATGEHVGQVLVAGEKFWKADKASIGGFVNMSVQTHRIKNLGLALAEMDTFSTAPAKQAGYPTTVWDAANIFLHESLDKNSSFKERLLASAVNFADKLHLDTLLTKISVSAADFIAGRVSKEYAESPVSQEYPQRPNTHPTVHRVHTTAPLPKEAEKELPAPAPSDFARRITNARQEAQLTTGTRGL